MRLFRKNNSEGQEEELPEEINVFEFSNKLKEFVGDFTKLVEKGEHLEKSILKEQEKIAKIEDLIPKLKEQKNDIQEGIKRKQEEISKIYEMKSFFELLHKNGMRDDKLARCPKCGAEVTTPIKEWDLSLDQSEPMPS